jgi:carbonic anhydrase
VGNIVPHYETTNNSELAAIEFAVVGLEVKDIIICGHTQCNAMQSLLNPKSVENMPLVADWLRHADSTIEIIKNRYADLEGDALTTAAAEENVLVQLEHLRTLPVIANRIAQDLVNLHGWMYNVETGEIFAYDGKEKQFRKIEK